MDFSYLLELAKANEEKAKTDNSYKFSTKVSTAKKISKAGPKKDAIVHHLSKIDDEKKKKDDEFLKKKNELLALRSKDKHSAKRVKCLITRTKGASKSVLEDAKDIAVEKAEAQCDEDDYGYESAMSQQIFSKLQNDYSVMPEDERLTFKKSSKGDMEEIKKRVMDSLKKKQEEDLGIRKRKRNKKSRKNREEEDDGFINDGDSFKKFQSNSDDEKKSHKEPFEKHKRKSKKSVDTSEFKLFKEDKYSNFKYNKDYERKKEEKEKKRDSERKKEEKEKRRKNNPPALSFSELMKVAQKKASEPLSTFDPVKELNSYKKKDDNVDERLMTAKEKNLLEEEKLWKQKRKEKKVTPENKTSKPSQINKNAEAPNPTESKLYKILKGKDKYDKKENLLPSERRDVPSKPVSSKSINPSNKVDSIQGKSLSNNLPPKSAEKSKPSIPKSNSRDVPQKPTTKPRPPDIINKPPPSFPSRKSIPPPPSSSSKRRVIDSESEYDSDMDDFIDDGDAEMDYSSEIAKMFKYDKSKFRDEPDDIDDMEVSYSQMQKEEKRSAKLGLMEDLEDMRREEMEKKRKMMMKKRKN